MKKQRVFFYLLALSFTFLLSCGERTKEITVYLSNKSLHDYDKAFVTVNLDGKQLISEPLNNQYLSGHWDEYQIQVPVGKTRFEIVVSSDKYEIKLDTFLIFSEGNSVFGTFAFNPLERKYNNDRIYEYIKPNKKVNFKDFADSLYSVGLLVLQDTLPDTSHLSVIVK